MTKTPLVLAALAAATLLGMAAQPASASPLLAGHGLAPVEGGLVQDVQFVERRIIRRGPGPRWRNRRVCRVEITRRRTARGVIVRRERVCR